MPRVNRVSKARKAQGSCSCGSTIGVGDSYKWIKFRYGGRRVKCSKCEFKRSELTRSAYLSQGYDLEDRFASIAVSFERCGDGSLDFSDMQSDMGDVASEFGALGEEQEESRDAMPESLQCGDVGTMLEERSSACLSLQEEIESAAGSLDEIEESLSDEEIEDEARSILESVSFDWEV